MRLIFIGGKYEEEFNSILSELSAIYGKLKGYSRERAGQLRKRIMKTFNSF